MATYDYDDFRVTFRRDDQGSYIVTARTASGQEVSSPFTLPMAPSDLEGLISRIGRVRGREIAPAAEVAVADDSAEKLGARLGDALFGPTLWSCYQSARTIAAEHARGLRLTLSLTETPELLGVPWELLYRKPTFLASQRRTPIVRYLEVGAVIPPPRIDGPVRVLGVVSNPTGSADLDVDDERSKVTAALQPMIDRGLVQVDWCDPATLRALRRRLADGTYHILHYIGHSDFTDSGEGLILLEDAEGGPAPVTESALAMLLGDQSSLRLVVLNSCEGARTTITDPFAGIATSLVGLGVPAVIAMQFQISDRAAIVFAEELFTSLIGRQFPVDAAVAEARKAVFTEVNAVEFATPVLFLRSTDDALFDFRAAPAEIPVVVPATPLEPDDGQGGDRDGPGVRPSRWRRTVVWVAPTRRKVGAGVAAALLIGTSIAVVAAVIDDEGPAGATCAGQPVPPRPAFTGADDVAVAFDVAQDWNDLVASATPDSPEDNAAIWEQMEALYPDTFSQEQLNDGYTNLEAIDLLYRTGKPLKDAEAVVYTSALIYDNATASSSCRTGLHCVRFVVDQDTRTILSRVANAPTFINPSRPYYDGVWLAADDVVPGGTSTVQQAMDSGCRRWT